MRTALFTGVLILTAMACSCGGGPQPLAGNSNRASRYIGLPPGASALNGAPGYYQAGPRGSVSLHLTEPKDGQVLDEDAVAPRFSVTGFPIYLDPDRNKGQHIKVILDNEPYEMDYDPRKPFVPVGGRFNDLKEGTHVLRAFPAREWHESIKQPDGDFDIVVFQVRAAQPVLEINQKAPLLTYSMPSGEYRWQEDPRGVMLDFYVSNTPGLASDAYKVRYVLDNKPQVLLTRWEPVWWKWEELAPGDHKVTLDLIDNNNKPVPFKVGSADFNHTERTFKVLGRGEQPSAGKP